MAFRTHLHDRHDSSMPTQEVGSARALTPHAVPIARVVDKAKRDMAFQRMAEASDASDHDGFILCLEEGEFSLWNL